jgi:hypothetical protein
MTTVLAWAALAPGPGAVAGEDPAPPPADSAKRVVYIPDSVKAEIAEQVRQEVMAEFAKQNYAIPNEVPPWTKRMHFFGDVRVRYELIVFPPGNANGGEFPDFYAINIGKPFDVKGFDLSADRYLNVDANRSRFRIRARVGTEVDLGDAWSLGVKIGTGDTNSPVSQNQTLGGSGGYFGKYQIWLDQAYIRFHPIHGERGDLMFEAGRFENPFFTARDLLWSENVNLDGFAFEGAIPAGAGWRPFMVLAASPVYATAFSYPVDQTTKYESFNKWLFAGQLGTDWRPSEKFSLKLGAALYWFHNVSGVVSPPDCDTNLANVTCSTDDSRPSYAQKGNTYIALRTPSPAALALEAAYPLITPRYQYFGLASQFRELVGTGRLDYSLAPSLRMSLEGEFAWNAGFSRDKVAAASPLNNCSSYDDTGSCTAYSGGNNAFVGRLTIGTPSESRQWDWNVTGSYLYVQSDSILDAFANPDFGAGGTNLKGYWIGGRVALANHLTLGVRWMSADAIDGPTYRSDLFQVDFWGRF